MIAARETLLGFVRRLRDGRRAAPAPALSPPQAPEGDDTEALSDALRVQAREVLSGIVTLTKRLGLAEVAADALRDEVARLQAENERLSDELDRVQFEATVSEMNRMRAEAEKARRLEDAEALATFAQTTARVGVPQLKPATDWLEAFAEAMREDGGQ